MKKTNILLSSLILATGLVIGLTVNTPAHSDTSNGVMKIAVIDVPQVVAQSAQVQALKKDEQAKKAELEKWLKTVKADVDKQQTKEGKEKLIKKYDAEFAKKANANKEAYVKRLSEIDASISSTIVEQAKIKGYDLVLAKSTVLYGGDDITKEISKVVK